MSLILLKDRYQNRIRQGIVMAVRAEIDKQILEINEELYHGARPDKLGNHFLYEYCRLTEKHLVKAIRNWHPKRVKG